MEITVKIKCPCETDACACCACVSMHCDECHGHSKFQQGSYCSHCGRPLKAELQRNYVPKSEVERLEHILNCYALQYGTVKDQHEVIDKAKADVAREIFMDIDRVIEKYSMGDIEYPAFLNIIAELKKKYTEGEG